MNIFSKSGKSVMKIDEVSSLLANLSIPIGLVFTPINLKEERERFFDSDTYEPHFRYRGVKNSNSEIFKRLSSLKSISDVDPRISDFYIQLIESKKDSHNLMSAVGNNELVSEISYRKYGKPTDLLFRNSARVLRGNVSNYNIVKYPTIKDEDILNYNQIEEIFNSVFSHFKLTEWKMQPSKNISKNSMKVGVKSQWVLVDPNIQKSKFKLKKSLIHEVGTHVFRSINGQRSGFSAFGNANLASYLDIEEGLATWNESYMDLLTLSSLKKKAAMTWAVYVGEKLSFRQLYNNMLGVFPSNIAFSTTYRVKRGLGDTSYPGIYSKDIVYFRGFGKVKKALEKDKSLYEKLYAGKIDLKQCEWVDDGLIPKAQLVPSKEEWKEVFKSVGI